MIHVYNITEENHDEDPNNYFIYRPSILSNPYTHIKDKKTLAKYVVKTREEALKRYETYFDAMYSGNKPFRNLVDDIYEKYKSGETVYLGCFCHPLPCHGDIIAEKLQQRLLKDKIKTMQDERRKV